MIFRKPKGEMTGFEWEVEIAEEEGMEMCGATLFKEIEVENDKDNGCQVCADRIPWLRQK